jgi:hypothetical protein
LLTDKELLVIDSTKLNVLDRLLCKLKRERHRVLIYCQMTRMIDLLEVDIEISGVYKLYMMICLPRNTWDTENTSTLDWMVRQKLLIVVTWLLISRQGKIFSK